MYWILIALLVILFLVWLAVTKPRASEPATSLGATLIGPSKQEKLT
jgi:uncharacterized membrane protein